MRQAFSLVELAIVLVIIGLLVGGVLVGRDLISAAAIKKTGKIISQLDTAANTFRNKYNCIPGDCAAATNFGFAANGNGNWKVYSSTNTGQENHQFFLMMITAGLISDTRICTQKSLTCGTDSIGWGRVQHIGLTVPFWTITRSSGGTSLGETALSIYNTNSATYSTTNGNIKFEHVYGFNAVGSKAYANVPVETSSQLDRKYDDGTPMTGIITIIFPQDDAEFANDARYYADQNLCTNSAHVAYYLADLSVGCTLTWKAAF